MSGPGSPSVQNVIAMDSLGTPSTAAFVPSLLTAIAMFFDDFLLVRISCPLLLLKKVWIF